MACDGAAIALADAVAGAKPIGRKRGARHGTSGRLSRNGARRLPAGGARAAAGFVLHHQSGLAASGADHPEQDAGDELRLRQHRASARSRWCSDGAVCRRRRRHGGVAVRLFQPADRRGDRARRGRRDAVSVPRQPGRGRGGEPVVPPRLRRSAQGRCAEAAGRRWVRRHRRAELPVQHLPRRRAQARARRDVSGAEAARKIAAQRSGLRRGHSRDAAPRRAAARALPDRRVAAGGLRQAADRHRLRHHRGASAAALPGAVAAALRHRPADRGRERRDLRDQGPDAERWAVRVHRADRDLSRRG